MTIKNDGDAQPNLKMSRFKVDYMKEENEQL